MRPKKISRDAKSDTVKVRLSEPEKLAFQQAATIAGIGLSTWIRERLRRAAVRELEEAGMIPQFLERT